MFPRSNKPGKKYWSGILPGNPLFESLLTFENYTLNTTLRGQGGGWINRQFVLRGKTNYPLAVNGYMEPELLLEIAYDEALFEASTIQRMLGHLRTALEGMIANPESRLGDLPILTEAEHHQISIEWNTTQAEYPRESCIHELFEAQVARNPDATAVVLEDQSFTYSELNQRANQLAHYLQSCGVGPEVLVGICMERSLEMIVGILGILKTGGGYVPLDPSYPKERLAFMLMDSDTPVLLTQSALVSSLPELRADIVCVDGDWPQIAESFSTNPRTVVNPENLAYVIYTSGSTGIPKGVAIEHRSVVALLSWAFSVFNAEDLGGGIVAFEMAQQLVAGDQTIALLALFDSRFAVPGETSETVDRKALLRLFARAIGMPNNEPSFSEELLERFNSKADPARLLEQTEFADLLPAGSDLEKLDCCLNILSNNTKASRHYCPRPYPGRVVLFKARENRRRVESWRAFASGGLRVHEIPGDHYSMLRKPHVLALAKILSKYLVEAQSSDQSDRGGFE